MLRTKSQRAKLCKDCPEARVADALGDSCSLLVMRDLLLRPRKFGELEDSLGGMSPRTLTQKLAALQKEGLITKRTYDTHPRYIYSLTKKGAAFQKVVDAMRAYGKRHL